MLSIILLDIHPHTDTHPRGYRHPHTRTYTQHQHTFSHRLPEILAHTNGYTFTTHAFFSHTSCFAAFPPVSQPFGDAEDIMRPTSSYQAVIHLLSSLFSFGFLLQLDTWWNFRKGIYFWHYRVVLFFFRIYFLEYFFRIF